MITVIELPKDTQAAIIAIAYQSRDKKQVIGKMALTEAMIRSGEVIHFRSVDETMEAVRNE